jgi:ubiquinone/menaquinone biosynthesis C-methylase UbiE
MNLLNSVKASLLAGQHGHPKGIIGYVLGEQMVRQHVPETDWTISLLKIQPEDHILELGFGAGRAVELVAAQAPSVRVAGIDISQTMLRAARRRNACAIKKGQVVLCHGDLMNLPFPDDSFDKVFSIQTLYFWPDPQRALAEIFRVLKPSGMLVITLSTGTVDPITVTGLEQYQYLLEEQILPAMMQLGYTVAFVEQGPASRQFKTTAVVGVT